MDLPWWTYEAIDAVDKFLADRGGQARIFEYGSGASTVWLARRSRSVDVVEHDADWAVLVRDLLASATGVQASVTVHTPEVEVSESPRVSSGAPSGHGLDFHRYVHTIDEVSGPPFDLLLVDGRAREASLLHALDRVAEDGLVLMDDAQRERYRPALAAAAAVGWSVTVTHGRTPCQPLPRATALLRRRTGAGPGVT
jgi:predicted O-methyltransferase YrrM